jgi:stress response protein YsnF
MMEEKLVVSRQLVLKEEIRIRTRQVTKEEEVRATTRPERVELEDATAGSVRGLEGDDSRATGAAASTAPAHQQR